MVGIDAAALSAAIRKGAAVEASGRSLAANAIQSALAQTELGHPRGLVVKGAQVAGTLDLRGMTIRHAVQFLGCDFERLTLDEATFEGKLVIVGRADGQRPNVIEGGVSLVAARLRGRCVLRQIEVGTAGTIAIDAQGAQLSGGLSTATTAPRFRDSLSADDGLVAHGALDFSYAWVGAELDLAGVRAESIGPRPAVDLYRARTGGPIYLEDCFIEGQLGFARAEIAGAVIARGVVANSRPADQALAWRRRVVNLGGATIGGDCAFRKQCILNGTVSLLRARVDGEFSLRDSWFLAGYEDGVAVDLSGVEIRGPAYIRETNELNGRLLARRATVGGRFLLPSRISAYRNSDARPDAERALIDMSFARVARLEHWAPSADIQVRGLTYEAIIEDDPERAWRDRVRAFATMPTLDPGVFDQLARVYRNHGLPQTAVHVLEAKERALTRRAPYPFTTRLFRLAEEKVTGYGYRPWRAIATSLIALVAAVVCVRLTDAQDWAAGGQPRGFIDALAWSADTFLPIVDLGEEKRFEATGGLARSVRWLLVVTGWAFGTILVAAFSQRALRR